MKLELISQLNIMHGERRRIHVIQHNTNDTKTRLGEKPEYMPSGLAFSTDVYNPNNSKDSYHISMRQGGQASFARATKQLMPTSRGCQATMNNIGMERGRIRKRPDNQSSGKAMAKIACCSYIPTGHRRPL